MVLDSARADAFDEVGVNLPAFAKEGTHFGRGIAPAGWTLPSHVSMFTGLSPTEHRIIATGGDKTEIRKKTRTRVEEFVQRSSLLAPRLRAAGIRTFSSTPNPWLGPATGLHAGFEETHFFGFLTQDRQPSVSRHGTKLTGVVKAAIRHARWIASNKDKGASRILEHLRHFLMTPSGPIFAFVNLIETHEPHVHPPSRREDRLRFLRAAANSVIQPGPVRAYRMRGHSWGGPKIPDRLLELWHNAYLAETRYVDDWIGRLQEVIEGSKRTDETVVIVTSDHGENLGENGEIGHSGSVSPSLVEVPLAIWGSQVPMQRCETQASLLHLRATIEKALLGKAGGTTLLDPSTWGRARYETEDPRLVSRPSRSAKRTAKGPGAVFYDGSTKLTVDPYSGEERLTSVSGGSVVALTPYLQSELSSWKERVAAS